MQPTLSILLSRPGDFRTLVQYSLYREQRRDIADFRDHDSTGWYRATMRRCWKVLEATEDSRMLSVKQLDGDLPRIVCLYLLALRELENIRNNESFSSSVRLEALRSVVARLHGEDHESCWRTGLAEHEDLLLEVATLDPKYNSIILDVCRRMSLVDPLLEIHTAEDFDRHCSSVAGIIGEGLGRIWVADGSGASETVEWGTSTAQLAHKADVVRDCCTDVGNQRCRWPRDLQPQALTSQQAQWAQSVMVANALGHAVDALKYLQTLKNQRVFNFCATPMTTAMATLDMCFMNPKIFTGRLELRDAQKAALIMRSRNPHEVARIFCEFSDSIRRKLLPHDPSFAEISNACDKIRQWTQFMPPPTPRPKRRGDDVVAAPQDTYTRVYWIFRAVFLIASIIWAASARAGEPFPLRVLLQALFGLGMLVSVELLVFGVLIHTFQADVVGLSE